jgi:chemotaxis response regulator CheB
MFKTKKKSRQDFFVAGLGFSAGGISALSNLIAHLPAKPDIAFVIVGHLHRESKSELHLILSRITSLKVLRIEGNEDVEADHIYVMPENKTVTIRKGKLVLSDRSPFEIINRAIDTFLNSLAIDQKEKSIGIILSGTGSDGAIGADNIHKNGGMVITQDPDTADFNSMPIAAIRKDNPDYIISPEEIGHYLVKMVHDVQLR